jgi:hypothetical protein
VQGEARIFLDKDVYCSYPIQPFILMNYVRAHRPSTPLLLIDALTQGLSITSWAFASLIIVLRMQVHYNTAYRHKSAECVSFQNRDMGTQYHRVVNRTYHVVGWSWVQHTMCVSLSRPPHNNI